MLKKKIKAVLFDLDGTLLDTEALSDKAIIFALEKVLPVEKLKELVASDYRLPWELKKQILGLRGSEWGPTVISYAIEKWNVPASKAPSVQELWSAWEENLNSFCSQVKACPGASEVVAQLADLGLPMAIATSSRQAAVKEKGKNHQDMFGKMSAIVAGDDPAVKRGKPAPDIYLEAAQRLGVAPHDCLVFEDALSGVKAGKAAGSYVVAVPDNRFSSDEKAAFSVADCVIDDLLSFDGTPFGIDLK